MVPEVNIGFLPGGQGTQRLPRIMQTDDALQLMLTGEHVAAQQALAWGIVDAIAPAGSAPIDTATELCMARIGSDLNPRRLSTVPPPPPSKRGFDTWRKAMHQMRSGEVAPQVMLFWA